MTRADDQVLAVIRAMAADHERLAGLVLARLEERVAMMTSSPKTLVADVRQVTRASTKFALESLAQGASTDALAPRFADAAKRRALQGVPVDQTLVGYAIASEVFLDAAAEYLPQDGSVSVEVPLLMGRRIVEWLRVATTAVAAGYAEASRSAAMESEQRIQARLERLARDQPVEDDADSSYRWCVVGPAHPPELTTAVRSFRVRYPQAVVGVLDGRVVGFLVEQPIGDPVVEHAGTAPVGDRGPAAAYRRASRAADVASWLQVPELRDDLAIPLAALHELPDRDRDAFVTAVLGPLADDERGWIGTVAAYVRHNGSVAAAARELHVHRHTLDYRLGRISELTGLDLTEPVARLQVQIALLFRGELVGPSRT